MATKKHNGHDSGATRMIEVLERIEKELSGLREEVQGFRTETRDELLDLHAEQCEQRTELESSIEVRLAKLEAVVFRATGT
ncbi:MAG: hypothetical protein WCI05_03385 [Myxococcales bacterium]